MNNAYRVGDFDVDSLCRGFGDVHEPDPSFVALRGSADPAYMKPHRLSMLMTRWHRSYFCTDGYEISLRVKKDG
jgi:hypothetical protein